VNLSLNMMIWIKFFLRDQKRDYINFIFIITAMSAAICCCFVIGEYLNFDVNHDYVFKNRHKTYRITTEISDKESEMKMAVTNGYLYNVLTSETPGVKDVARMQLLDYDFTFGVNDKRILVDAGSTFMVDPYFLSILGLDLEKGDRQKSLEEPSSIVISDKVAKSLFGNENPIDQTIDFISANGSSPYKVTGVFKSLPPNSHIQFDVLITSSGVGYWKRLSDPANGGYNLYVYFSTLQEISDVSSIKSIINQSTQELFDPSTSFHVQPIQEIYFDDSKSFDFAYKSDLQTNIILFIFATVLLLTGLLNNSILMATNFIRTYRRSVTTLILGNSRTTLILGEFLRGIWLMIASTLLAFLMTHFLKQYELLNLLEVAESVEDSAFLPISLIVIIASAALMSLFPVKTIIGLNRSLSPQNFAPKSSTRGWSVLQMFVVVQLFASFLIITTGLTINEQLQFLTNRDKGFESEGIWSITRGSIVSNSSWDYLKTNLLKDNRVGNVGVMRHGFVDDYPTNTVRAIHSETNDTIKFSAAWNAMAPETVAMMGLNMVIGRNFDPQRPSDKNAVIINETSANVLNINSPADLNDYRLSTWLNREGLTVIGVVQDFYYQGFEKKLMSTMIYNPDIRENFDQNVIVKSARPGVLSFETLKMLSTESNISTPLNYHSLDARYKDLTSEEWTLMEIIFIMTAGTIVIALFGFYTALKSNLQSEQKSLMIRRILGADITQLLVMYLQRALIYSVVSFCLMLPISLYLLSSWLDNYSYRIELTYELYLISGTLVVLTGFILTASSIIQPLSKWNPVEVIRRDNS